MKNRNILIIETDEHHYRWLGFQGAPGLKTPNLDRLAQERGVIFDHAYACSAVCAPSRTSFMSGRYSLGHGVVNNQVKRRNPDEPRLGKLLQEAGYSTGFFGKTHIGGDDDMENEGWGESFIIPQYNDYLKENGIDVKYPEGRSMIRKEARYRNFGQSRILNEHYLENVLAKRGVDFINRCAHEPFACYVNNLAPHGPFSAPGHYADMYDPDDMVLTQRMANELEGKPPQTQKWIKQNQKYDNDDELRRWLAVVYGMITMIDDNVGKLISALESNNLLDDTLIVFTSDHGDFASRYGIIGKSWTMTDDLVRTPLLVAMPGAKPRRTDALVQNIDVTTTILDWAGAQIPSRMHGRSFLPLLEKGANNHREYVFSYDQAEYSQDHLYLSMVRSLRWKYIQSSGATKLYGELYDMQNDPEECNNLIDSEEHQKIVSTLRSKLLDWHVSCSGGFYDTDNANYWEDATGFYDENVFCGQRLNMDSKEARKAAGY